MKKLFDDVVGGVLGLVDDEAGAGSAKWEKALDAAMDIVLEARAKVRAEKNWAESDRIRDVLASAGISVKDTKEGPTWSIN
jgi:cysteinyl-tRNA synthetase